MCIIICRLLFCDGQSAGSDARLTAETDNTDAVVLADADSSTASQLDASLSAAKEYVNPRGIRFTTVSSHGPEG